MGSNKNHVWLKAVSFAARCHRHQVRKDGKTPYVAHPFRVAMIVRDVFEFDDEETLAAALLHDTVEDTATDYDDIEKEFGQKVADIVAALTKNMSLPKAQREAAYDQQLAAGPQEARLIKLADVYDNITDAKHSPSAIKADKKVERALALVREDELLVDAANKLRQQCERLQRNEES